MSLLSVSAVSVDMPSLRLMIPSMSRPANPYDNASCESFMKTLKREEIYANAYENLERLRANLEIFLDEYYNQPALGTELDLGPDW